LGTWLFPPWRRRWTFVVTSRVGVMAWRGSGQPMPMLTIVNPWDWLAADGSYPPIPRVSSTAAGRDGVMVESMV